MSFPEGFAIFSDDIRHEIGGKTSIMGIYSGVMYIHTADFPQELKKLGLSVYLKWPSREEIEPVKIQIFFSNNPESPAIEAPVDLSGVLDQLPDPQLDSFPGVTMSSVLEGVPVTPGTAIEVYVESAEERRRIGRLRTMHAPATDSARDPVGQQG